jgi:hypothetical protein
MLARLFRWLNKLGGAGENAGAHVEGRAIVGASVAAGRYSRVGIQYCDADGCITERVISVGQLIAADSPGEHSMIVAYCHLREDLRSFRVDRIQGFFDPDTLEPLRAVTLVADPAALHMHSTKGDGPPVPFPQTLSAVLSTYRESLEGAGWIVALENQIGGERLACYRRNKRTGARLKYPSVEFEWQPNFIDDVVDSTGKLTSAIGRPRVRPWGVRGEKGSLGTWGTIDKAMPAFIAATGLPPSPVGLAPVE